MENKMGRYPKDHPRAGGYIVMWAAQTLNSEKLRHPLILGCLVKILCAVQLVDFTTGRFEKGGMAFSMQTIAHRAGITVEQFNNLVGLGLVVTEVVNSVQVYSIKSWNEHQNPKDSGSAERFAFKVRKEPHFSDKKSADIHASVNKHHASVNKHHASVNKHHASVNKPKSKFKSEKVKV